jgi:predicted esterase
MATADATGDATIMGTLSDEEPPPSKSTTIVNPSGAGHTHTVIFLHGREDFGEYMAEFLNDKSSDSRTLPEKFPTMRWVFPTAKIRFSARRKEELCISSFPSLEGEQFISQWFDVWDVRNPEERKELAIPGLRESIRQILVIIEQEAKIVPTERIILGGLSQGCATAILTLLSSGLEIGAFIGWCGWLPLQRSIEEFDDRCIGNKRDISRHIQTILQSPDGNSRQRKQPLPESNGLTSGPGVGIANSSKDDAPSEQIVPASDEITSGPGGGIPSTLRDVKFNKAANILSGFPEGTQPATKTPLFLAHSEDDDIVPFELGNDLHQIMKRLGFNVTWKKYKDGGHWIQPDHGLDDMCTFLEGVMNI